MSDMTAGQTRADAEEAHMFELAIILDGKQIDTTHDDEITLRRHFVGFMDDHDLRRKGDSNRGELIRCTTDQVVGSYEVWRG